MRKRTAAPVAPWMNALDAALDELPSPDSLTPEQNLRIAAALDRVAERLERRELELRVKMALDEYQGPIPIHRTRKAS